MSSKTTFSITPMLGAVKTILPGILVSIVGGSFVFLVFNNPEKLRGRATLRAWKSLQQYEQLYIQNTELISCNNSLEIERFRSDMLHQLQMTSDNLKNILEKENNVDNLMLAIINLKIDSYNEMKKITGQLMDTILTFNLDDYHTEKEINKIISRGESTYSKYMDEIAHVQERDTTTINKILEKLSNIYSEKFVGEKSFPELKELRRKIIGKWSIAMSFSEESFELNEDSTGRWEKFFGEMAGTFNFTWQLDSSVLRLKFKDRSIDTLKFSIKRVTDDILSYSQLDERKNNSYIACRKER